MLPGSQVTCFASWGQPLLLCGLCLSFLKKGCNDHYMGEALESRILVLPLVLCKSPHRSSHGKMGGWECPFRMSLRAGVGWFGVGQFGSPWAQDADAAPPAKALEPKRTTEFAAPPPPPALRLLRNQGTSGSKRAFSARPVSTAPRPPTPGPPLPSPAPSPASVLQAPFLCCSSPCRVAAPRLSPFPAHAQTPPLPAARRLATVAKAESRHRPAPSALV